VEIKIYNSKGKSREANYESKNAVQSTRGEIGMSFALTMAIA